MIRSGLSFLSDPWVWWLVPALLAAAPARTQTTGPALHVATASNFAAAMNDIERRFEAKTGQSVVVSLGSSGKHYAQILNGAPFDVLFAADIDRPALLEAGGHAVAGSRFTYAIGRLALWSTVADRVDSSGTVLQSGAFRYLAIANPALAPYGAAAREVLEALGLWEKYQTRIVRGENVSHAFNFVRSGNADMGFVALSQIRKPHNGLGGSFWVIPQTLYTPIEQQAVLLRDSEVARAFLSFVQSDEGLSIIRAHGYETP